MTRELKPDSFPQRFGRFEQAVGYLFTSSRSVAKELDSCRLRAVVRHEAVTTVL